MVRVEVYGKADCCLCARAMEVLRGLRRDLPFELAEVDIALDPALEARYRREVPVVFVDGRKALSLRFAEKDARRCIERAIALAEGSERAGRPALSPRALRRVQVAFAALALLALAGVLLQKGWEVFVREPRLAEEGFDITRVEPVAAPDFRAEAPGGRPFSLADARGEVLFLNFWATWCPPCKEEMPSMLDLGRELAREFPGRFRMVAVSVDEDWGVVRQFFGGALPREPLVTLDRTQETTKAYYCAARGGCPESFKFPESYIVDGKGRLVAYVVGPRDWSGTAPRRFLRRLLGG